MPKKSQWHYRPHRRRIWMGGSGGSCGSSGAAPRCPWPDEQRPAPRRPGPSRDMRHPAFATPEPGGPALQTDRGPLQRGPTPVSPASFIRPGGTGTAWQAGTGTTGGRRNAPGFGGISGAGRARTQGPEHRPGIGGGRGGCATFFPRPSRVCCRAGGNLRDGSSPSRRRAGTSTRRRRPPHLRRRA